MNRRAAFLYQFLIRKKKIRIIGNMYHSNMVGHMIQELDNFLRMRYLGEIDRECAYVAILQGSILAVELTRAYPHLFELRDTMFDVDLASRKVQFVMGGELFQEALQVHLFHPEFFVDVGLSNLKARWSSPVEPKKAHFVNWEESCYLWFQSNKDWEIDLRNHDRRVTESFHYRPWSEVETDESFYHSTKGKLALVHLRYRRPATNGGTLTDPSALIPTLAYLNDNGYIVLKIGTEPYPPEFAAYDVLNYSESPMQSFSNDLRLFKSAAISIINASGLNHIPDLMGTPTVNYGGWQFYNMWTSANCVTVPSLLRRKDDGRLLTLEEQFISYKNRRETYLTASEDFPSHDFTERPPLPDEILAGVKEAIAIGSAAIPRTEQQNRIISFDPYNYRYVRGRLSQYFLERHI